MKKFTKGFLTLSVLATMSLMAAEDPTILVTTFADEDGENLSQCSLREAVTAAALHRAYGGCSKGDPYATNVKRIQLEEGTYILNRELTPNSNLYILGKEPADYSRPNAINNDYPAKTKIKTTISGKGTSRLFNTIQLNKPGLTLEGIILDGGYSLTAGGALLLGGSTQLNNVIIQNSEASTGGAIYLNDVNSHLTITNSVIQKNHARTGSVLAMTCLDGLNYTARKIEINRSTLIENGAEASQSMLAFCGQPTVTIGASTLNLNTANAATGSIIQFSGQNGSTNTNLSPNATLGLLSNTIVKNKAAATLLYDGIAGKTLNYNVLAFNTGKSCKYNSGDISTVESANVIINSNAIHLKQNDICELPTKALTDDVKKNLIDLDGTAFETIFSDLQQDKEYTDFIPMYFPRENTSGVDLVDASGSELCSDFDQRGIRRIRASESSALNAIKNTCDIGSTEVLRLTVQNITDVNKSVVLLLQNYQDNYDLFQELVENKDTKPELLPYYTLRRDEFSRLLKYTKSEQKYRTIFIDPFISNLPDEIVLPDGGRQIQHMTPDNYTVTVKSLGVGKLGSDGKFIGQPDANLHCDWNDNLKQVLVYRSDDRLTADADFEFCQYTLTSRNSKKSASAYVLARFTNIQPIVPVNLDVTVQHGGDQKVSVDLLKDASDDGDGLVSTLDNPNKSAFYLNRNGQTQAIRIVSLPNPVSVQADRSGPCPNLDSKYTCYGGNVTMQLNNTLDVFSYKVKYVVYDAEGAVSGEGTVQLKNTATQEGSVRNSGGGSMGLWTLFGLAGLVGYRLRQQRSRK